MLLKILMACFLVAATVFVHAVGLTALLNDLLRKRVHPPTCFWPVSWLLIRVAWALIFIHVIEITIWALFYAWEECLPDVHSAFYFSGVTYTTVGYGDVLLSDPWRLFAPVEALTGILMCGLSTGLFFAVVSRLLTHALEMRTK